MKLTHILAAAALAVAVSTPAMAVSDKDADTFLLTPALFEKMKKAEPDLKALDIKDESDDEDSDSTVNNIIKSIDKHPQAKAVLAKHGLSSKEVALASVAMVHAGMFVALEGQMDKKGAADLMKSYTREQRANIAFMRTVANTK